jgi:hypothetical protein
MTLFVGTHDVRQLQPVPTDQQVTRLTQLPNLYNSLSPHLQHSNKYEDFCIVTPNIIKQIGNKNQFTRKLRGPTTQ